MNPHDLLDIFTQAIAENLKIPKSGRAFWGRLVRANKVLRNSRDRDELTLPRKDLRKLVLEAFEAGRRAGS